MSVARPEIAPAEPWAFPVPTETWLDNGIRQIGRASCRERVYVLV